MELTISSVDYAPAELEAQTPFVVDLLRQLAGDDRPDYWLAHARTPIRWLHQNHDLMITHIVLAARWEGTKIEPGIANLPVGIAFVRDQSLLDDSRLDFAKCAYVAIGIAHDTGEGKAFDRPSTIMAGTIGRFFGTGNR